jgi:hypothetical protein
MLKLKPFERYVGDDQVINYVGIRADEDRTGYISHKPNIIARYPFVEDGIARDDVIRILEESGLGLPGYYQWRSRSGCYFCFFQQRIEWVGLLENHPDLFAKAMSYEDRKADAAAGRGYCWNQRESLRDLSRPERIAAIRAEHARRSASTRKQYGLLAGVLDADDDADRPCLICTL